MSRWFVFMQRLNTMFKQTSNVACKNILFNQFDMRDMHESMLRLYKFAREHKKITGQTELGVALGGESPQTVKNWEARGISQRGANLAQKKFGCDANWLLGKSEIALHTDRDQSTSRLIATESDNPWIWPFKRVSPEQYALLDPEEKRHIEKDILIRVKNRGDPEKQDTPANYSATGKAA